PPRRFHRRPRGPVALASHFETELARADRNRHEDVEPAGRASDQDALWHMGRQRAHAGRGGSEIQRHTRAHTPDRSQSPAQTAAPIPQPQTTRFPRSLPARLNPAGVRHRAPLRTPSQKLKFRYWVHLNFWPLSKIRAAGKSRRNGHFRFQMANFRWFSYHPSM